MPTSGGGRGHARDERYGPGIIGRPVEGLGAIAAGRALAEASGLAYVLLRADNNLTFLALRDPRAGLESHAAVSPSRVVLALGATSPG